MEDFNYLLKIGKKELISRIMEQVQNECGQLMFTQSYQLRNRLKRQNKFTLAELIIQSELNNSFMADELHKQINYSL